MNQKAARFARIQSRRPPARSTAPSGFRSPRGLAATALAVVAIAGAAVFLARPSNPSTPKAALAGQPAPAFDELDVRTGQTVSSSALRGRNTLLFFSEGVMCQACFEQIKALEYLGDELDKRGLTLVSITTDPPGVLRRVADAYQITTPLISDEDRDMSRAYDVLGQGMHPDTAGHTFVLVDADNRIRWRRDYTRMFVPPDELLASLPRLERAG